MSDRMRLIAATAYLLVFVAGASARWRLVGWATGALCLVFVVTNGLAEYVGSALDHTRVTNPIAPAFMDRFGDPDDWVSNLILQVAVVLLTAAAAVALVRRGRRARGVEREQIRWFSYGAVCLVGALLLGAALGPVIDSSPIGSLVSNALLALGLAMLPLVMGVAILRYRLYDIDRLVSRTASYTIVTALVLATYAAVVAFVSTLLPDKASALPVAVATLAAAAVFSPLLRRVQSRVDRRFDRQKYDALRVVEQFGERLRSETDSHAALVELLSVVDRTVLPTSANVWLADRRGSPDVLAP